MLDYKGKSVLAPMVRVSESPLRKSASQYGADLVWGPEIVDKRLIASKRVWNEQSQTIDYINSKNHTNSTWRMSPSLEQNKVVFQLGSSDPNLAVEAAKLVAEDVAAIDSNCGCPKHFSVHSGMGSQLLRTPDKLEAILKRLVTDIGELYKIPISAKIRILPDTDETFAIVRRIVKTGISHLTVHCRTPAMRPIEDADYTLSKEIANICHEAGITCYVNGDIQNREHMKTMCEKYGVDGAMLARSAQFNPSSFTGTEQDMKPILEICRGFSDACIAYNFNAAHAKYNLMNFVGGKSPLYAQFAQSKTLELSNEHLTNMEAKLAADDSRQEESKRNNKMVEAKETETKNKSREHEQNADPTTESHNDATPIAEEKSTGLKRKADTEAPIAKRAAVH